MFVRNAWYVAAWDHEVGRSMLRRIILDEPVDNAILQSFGGADGIAVGTHIHRFGYTCQPRQALSASSSGEGSLTLPIPPSRACSTSLRARALPLGEAKAASM